VAPLGQPAKGSTAHGEVSQITIPGTQSKFNARPAFVWVPPAFFATPRPHLPVVVVLAGVPGQPDNMIRAASANKTADRYAAAHGGVAPILIFADSNGSFTADTECVDSPAGNAETYLTKDVPSYVEQAFGTLTGPTHWAIEGYSEGGTCAITLALAHPDVFGSFVDIAGDQFANLGTQGDAKAKAIAGLYGGNAALFDAHDPMQLMLLPAAKAVAGWFEVGVKDHRKGDVASTLDAAMRQAGLQSQLVQAPGGHDFVMATQAVADSFAWLAGRVGA
jgi:S-formylglutathione hydrolase FrmB